jgi:hypothetical protein
MSGIGRDPGAFWRVWLPDGEFAQVAAMPNERIESNDVPLEPTSVRLDDEARRFLRQEARTRGVSESEVVRQAITFYAGYLVRLREEDEGRPPEGAGPR